MREVALANEAMVEEWSLGTADILERLDGDIALLLSLFEAARPCTNLLPGSTVMYAHNPIARTAAVGKIQSNRK
jgi:hypothetical protein